jgi:hypothetical protein
MEVYINHNLYYQCFIITFHEFVFGVEFSSLSDPLEPCEKVQVKKEQNGQVTKITGNTWDTAYTGDVERS